MSVYIYIDMKIRDRLAVGRLSNDWNSGRCDAVVVRRTTRVARRVPGFRVSRIVCRSERYCHSSMSGEASWGANEHSCDGVETIIGRLRYVRVGLSDRAQRRGLPFRYLLLSHVGLCSHALALQVQIVTLLFKGVKKIMPVSSARKIHVGLITT